MTESSLEDVRGLLDAACRMIQAADHESLWRETEAVLRDIAGRPEFWVVAYPLAGPVFYASEAARTGGGSPSRSQLDRVLSGNGIGSSGDALVSVGFDDDRTLDCLFFSGARGGLAIAPAERRETPVEVVRVLRAVLPAAIDALSRRRIAAEAAMRDPLTGLLNRREFERRFLQEASRCARSDAPLSVVIGDIDHFKRINASFGHLQGDLVLREVTERLVGALRLPDVVARLGPEEFVILLPDCSEKKAEQVAERLRAAIADAPFKLLEPAGETWITMSFGLSSVQGPAPPRWDHVVQRVEKALGRAKWEGRNKVMVARPPDR